MPRQQRPARNRRQQSVNNAPPWTMFMVEGAVKLSIHTIEVFFVTAHQPPDTSNPIVSPVITQTPNILRLVGNAFPTAVSTPTDNSIILTYGGTNIADNESFAIGPWDPGLRTREGGWCAPCYFQAPPEP